MLVFLQALLIVGGTIAAALICHYLVRNRVSVKVLEEHHQVAGTLMGLVASIYGILAAFLIVSLWGNFEECRKAVAEESNAGADLYRIGMALPAPTGPAILKSISDYYVIVITEEWPLMAKKQFSQKADAQFDNLWQDLTAFSPTDDREKNLHTAGIQTLERFSDQRRLRFVLANRSLPALLWVLLIAGGIILLGFANFFDLRYPRSQYLMTAAVAAIVGLSLFTVDALNHPFGGGVRVSPAEMEQVGRRFKQMQQ
jgi:hypothetical protein